MGLHDRGEQGLLAGKIAVEGAGGHPGILHDLPQGGPLEAFIQEFRHSGLLNFSNVVTDVSSTGISPVTSLYNGVIIQPAPQFVKGKAKSPAQVRRAFRSKSLP